MRPSPPLQLHPSQAEAGFSLVEMIVAVALLVVASVGSLVVFNIATRQNNQSRDKQEEQSAISADLATIQSMNDRYSCSDSGAETLACTVSDSDPGENDYYAGVSAPSAASNLVDEACDDGSLIDALVEEVDELEAPAAFERLGINRNVEATPTEDDDRSPLRYTVTWSKNSGQTQLRQITLVPTVANWCP